MDTYDKEYHMNKTMRALFMASLGGVVFLLASSSHALEFSRSGGTFTMSGPVLSGDAERFIDAYVEWDQPPNIFYINSPGGDVGEAMLIGLFIRESQTPVWSGPVCNSACALIFVAGVERLAIGGIGLHRPKFPSSYYAGLSSRDAAKAYTRGVEAITEYMQSMGVSQAVIDRMYQADSGQMDILSPDESIRVFGQRIPFYEEWIAAKCGRFSGRYAHAAHELLGIERIDFSTSVGKEQVYQHIEKLRAKGSKTPDVMGEPEFANAWHKYQACVMQAEDSHVRAFFKAIQKRVAQQ